MRGADKYLFDKIVVTQTCLKTPNASTENEPSKIALEGSQEFPSDSSFFDPKGAQDYQRNPLNRKSD